MRLHSIFMIDSGIYQRKYIIYLIPLSYEIVSNIDFFVCISGKPAIIYKKCNKNIFFFLRLAYSVRAHQQYSNY